MRTLLVAALLVCAPLAVAACDDNSPSREEFIQKAEDRIQSLRDDLQRLREELANGEAGDEVQQKADQLEERINEAEDKLDEIRAANEDEWKKFKGDFNQTVDDAGDLAKNVGKELGID